MLYVVALIIGAVVGGVIVTITLRSRVMGYLRVDNSDPDDGPYLFLELFDTVPSLYDKNYVTLQVKAENFISQK